MYRLITEKTVEEKIIERAEKKLLLDAVVIQQGRLASPSAKISTREMASIVTYGADFIFSSEKGTFTVEEKDWMKYRMKILIRSFRQEKNGHNVIVRSSNSQ